MAGFLDFQNRPCAIAALAHIPPEVCWGPRTPKHDFTDTVCWWNRPLRVWAVGYVRQLVWQVRESAVMPDLTVSLELLCPADVSGLAACGLVYGTPCGMCCG